MVANQLFPLLGIGEEKVRPNTLAFGKLISVDGRRLKILEIRRDATWYKKTSHFQLSGITWLQFGGHYEEALWAIGGTQ